MTSWKSFSQNDTVPKKIQLTSPVARLVIKDLIKGDALSEEVKVMQQILTSTNDKMLAQADLALTLRLQVSNLQTIIDQKDQQIISYEQAKSDLQKALKREQRTKKLYKIGSTVGVAAILINILGK